MRQQYHDGIAIVRASTKPDIFITMTCNPKWSEITENILPHQSAQDRPDIVARVFKLKLDLLMDDLINKSVFGKVIAHMHTIEFQKRGLPHVHILLILDTSDKTQTSEDVDTIVSTEIPDQTKHPELYETVINTMLHGPCGPSITDASCMINDKCSKRYPKNYCDHTKIISGTYPEYRRRDNGVFVMKGPHQFTNCDIIPYNPFLSAKYNCHINVEIANSILAVKYLYKYIYKGHDRTCISIEREQGIPIDEIKEYLDSRYVSACEACWRIFGFSLHHHYPSVQRLQLHLQNQQRVMFNPESQTPQQLLQQNSIRKTTLTAFFEACNRYPDIAKDLLYPDFPTKFTWDKTHREWIPRRSGFTIGRVYFAVPSEGERYYLRMLLYTVKCPTSLEALRTYEGIIYPTYKEACIARGLLETDEEWDICLTEAGSFQTGHQLRQLFATILLNNSPANPIGLFYRHFHLLSDDCQYRLQTYFHIENPSQDQITSLTLQDIKVFLEQVDKSLSDFNLPEPTIQFHCLDGIPRIIAEELNYNTVELQSKWKQGYNQTNHQQRIIFDSIISAVESGNGGLFFIDGPGGTGKTFVENLILARVRCTGRIALAVASSGIASILLDGGRTSHSRFKIPLDILNDSVCDVKVQSTLAELFRQTVLIIWDEAPAQNRYCFEAVNRTLKDICNNDQWFGGIVTVFSGTFNSKLCYR
jgi:PIF1-like helicase/Helitron helicase-like domain at N-terminus